MRHWRRRGERQDSEQITHNSSSKSEGARRLVWTSMIHLRRSLSSVTRFRTCRPRCGHNLFPDSGLHLPHRPCQLLHRSDARLHPQLLSALWSRLIGLLRMLSSLRQTSRRMPRLHTAVATLPDMYPCGASAAATRHATPLSGTSSALGRLHYLFKDIEAPGFRHRSRPFCYPNFSPSQRSCDHFL